MAFLRKLIAAAKALSEQQVLILLVGASALTLLAAHAFETFGNLPPCPLCLDQREAYWAAISFGLLGLVSLRLDQTRSTLLPWALLAFTTLSLGYGAYLAGFHAGVEYKWWAGPASCTASGAGMSIADMLALTEGDVVLCDEIPWSLFGISMAGYNFLIATGLTLTGAAALARRLKAN